jgi:mannose-6-phosphate isomerase-like protein (cupin superfamily)
MILKTSFQDIKSYVTKDGSSIRELIHPQIHGNSFQSLAEATVPVGSSTILHRHNITEEIYHILSGSGLLQLGTEFMNVEEGDSICIQPGTGHNIKNTGERELKILCCCSPAYSHDDTEILD